MSDTRIPNPGPQYAVGDRVRVRRGVTDPDFPDLPIGGWAGTIVEVQTREFPPTYLIRWSGATLDAVHPVHRKRSERDGFEIGEMWLEANELESDDGTSVAVEQPTAIVTKPLSSADQDDRIRAIFGLTSDDPLPDVTERTLRTFHDYLAGHMRLPIEAAWESEHGRKQTVTILGLSEPDEDQWADGLCGLLCQARVQGQLIEIALADCKAKPGSPDRQLLADYGYWFGNWG